MLIDLKGKLTLLKGRESFNKLCYDKGLNPLKYASELPSKYPCLGFLLSLNPHDKPCPVYLYPEDVQPLFDLLAAETPSVPVLDDEKKSTSQYEFNASILALVRTVIAILLFSGITTPEDFKKAMMESVSEVDQMTAEQRDRFLDSGVVYD